MAQRTTARRTTKRTTSSGGTDALHAPAMALYNALVKVVPDGSDRVTMTLEEIVRKGRVARRFTNGNGKVDTALLDRAWRYLRDAGAVEIVGRAKRPLESPEKPKRATRATKAKKTRSSGSGRSAAKRTGRSTGRTRNPARSRSSAKGTTKRSSAAATKTPKTASTRAAASGATNGRASDGVAVLAGALDAFTGQLTTSLERMWALRQEIAATEDQLSALEAEHNRQVNELAAFRNELRDARLAAFFDTMVGDELWVYETPAPPAA